MGQIRASERCSVNSACDASCLGVATPVVSRVPTVKYSCFLRQVIRRDITRTYPEHDFFKEKNGLGQESLFNVMKVRRVTSRYVSV